jgi:hypothetical protein
MENEERIFEVNVREGVVTLSFPLEHLAKVKHLIDGGLEKAKEGARFCAPCGEEYWEELQRVGGELWEEIENNFYAG